MVPDRWHPQNERRAPAIFASSSRVSIERFADICIPLRVVRFLTRLKTLYFPSFPIPRPPQWLKGKFPFLPLEIVLLVRQISDKHADSMITHII